MEYKARIFFVFLVWFLFRGANCQFPVIVPSVEVAKVFVEDKANGVVSPLHQALPWFFCEKSQSPKVKLPKCKEHMILHMKDSFVKVTFGWVNKKGVFSEFPEKPTIQITSPFTSKTLPSRVNQVTITGNLPRPNFPLVFSVDIRNQSRSLTLIHDTIHPRFTVTPLTTAVPIQKPIAKFLVTANEEVFLPPRGAEGNSSCQGSIPKVSVGSTVAELMESSPDCPGEWNVSNSTWVLNVTGAKRWAVKETSKGILVIAVASKGVPSDVLMTVPKGTMMDHAGNLNLQDDFAVLKYRPTIGVPSRTRSNRLRKREFNLTQEPGIVSATALGKAATAAVTTSVAMSAATSAAASSAGGAAGGSGGGAGGEGGNLTLLAMLQKLFLMGQMAVEDLPENFEAFVAEFDWAVLDIPLPFGRKKDGSKGGKDGGEAQARESRPGDAETLDEGVLDEEEQEMIEEEMKEEEVMVLSVEGESVEDGQVQEGEEQEGGGEDEEEEESFADDFQTVSGLFGADDEEGPHDHLARVLFWMSLGLMVVFTIHVSCLCLCLCRRMSIPDICQFPRIELLLSFWAIPGVAVAAARLFSGNSKDVTAAILLMVMFPALFVGWNIYMLCVHFYMKPFHERKANLVFEDEELYWKQVSLNQKVKGVSVPLQTDMLEKGGTSEEGQAESQTTGEKESGGNRWYSCFGNFFLGTFQQEGEWVATRDRTSKFIARYGILFEDHRGHVVVRSTPTFQVDPDTGMVDRGQMIPLKQNHLFIIPKIRIPWTKIVIANRRTVYRFHIQTFTRVLDFAKIILIGCIVAGTAEENKDQPGQLIALLIVVATSLVLARMSTPFPTRRDMTITVLSEVADVLTLAMGMMLIFGPSDDPSFRVNIGKGMLVAEGFALMAMMLEKLTQVTDLWGLFMDFCHRKRGDRFAEAVMQAMARDRACIERKYFDRWMVKVLKKGLRGRHVRREELPVHYYVKQRLKQMTVGPRHAANRAVKRLSRSMKTIAERQESLQ